MTPPPGPDSAPNLADKVRFLSTPAAYAAAPAEVRVLETHMSWIFLTGQLAYKLKKPVRYPFLDFTTIGRRRRFCALEVRLNRRLAGDVYRRITPLTWSHGALAIDGQGTVVDWLVEMEQLPEDRMLHVALHQGTATREQVLAAAEMLGRFYAGARPQRRDGRYYLIHLNMESAVTREVLTRGDLGLDTARTKPLLARFEVLLERHTPLIRERIAMGCVVEGHGDLRPEHVALGPPPRVIDCLEFDRPMRLLDPYDEINYLGLECGLIGAEWVRPLVLDVLDQHLHRRPADSLLATWAAFRALLRARICIAHLFDDAPADPGHWRGKAERYLALAESECASAEAPAGVGSTRRRVAALSFPPAAVRS